MNGREEQSSKETAFQAPPSAERSRDSLETKQPAEKKQQPRLSGTFAALFGNLPADVDEQALQDCLIASFHSLMDGMFLLDREGCIVAMNPAAESIIGCRRETAVGQRLADLLFPPSGRVRFHKNLSMYLQQGVSGSLLSRRIDEFQARRQTGGSFPAELTTLPLASSGKIGFAVFLRDVSERVKAEKQLRQAKAEADTANRAKSAFLAMMSHDIRTPMNAIIGMTELVLDTKLEDSQREYLEIVHESGESLLTLINDILDFSKIEAGKFALEDITFRPREVLADSMKSIALRARDKDVEVACRIDPATPEELIGDPARLRQIIVNLAGNAIKFTEQGEVVVDVRPAIPQPEMKIRENSIQLHFTVSDTGIGIPQDRLEQIFGEFEQAESTTARRYGGTGLGLTIARKLSELMHGRMWVESEPERGSDFHFTARFQLCPSEKAISDNAAWCAQIAGRQILILGRNETVRNIVKEQLSAWGVMTNSAERLKDALASPDGPHSFDLIICDYSNLDSRELQNVLRATRPDGRQYPLILMHRPGESVSARSLASRTPPAIKLMKPLKLRELRTALAKGLELDDLGRKEVEVSPTSDQPLKPLKILLVEDSPVNQKLAIVILNKRGHTVSTAENGQEAVDLVLQNEFDLVLMDVEMPVMDGIKATALIREREQKTGRHLPIVAMTAHAMKGDQQRFLKAGMDEYVSKPIRTGELFQKIAALVNAEASKPGATTPQAKPAVIDWCLARELVGHDMHLLRGVISVLLQELPKLLNEIRGALQAEDCATLKRAAHTLKGSLKCVGVIDACHSAERLEELGIAGDLAAATAETGKLEETLKALQPVLVRFLETGTMEQIDEPPCNEESALNRGGVRPANPVTDRIDSAGDP